MVPIKRTVFLLIVYGMKNTVRLIGTLEYVHVQTKTTKWREPAFPLLGIRLKSM